HRPTVEQLADPQAVAGLRRDLSQYSIAVAAVLLVGFVARGCARSAPGLGNAAGCLRQQSRGRFPGAARRSGASLDAACARPWYLWRGRRKSLGEAAPSPDWITIPERAGRYRFRSWAPAFGISRGRCTDRARLA